MLDRRLARRMGRRRRDARQQLRRRPGGVHGARARQPARRAGADAGRAGEGDPLPSPSGTRSATSCRRPRSPATASCWSAGTAWRAGRVRQAPRRCSPATGCTSTAGQGRPGGDDLARPGRLAAQVWGRVPGLVVRRRAAGSVRRHGRWSAQDQLGHPGAAARMAVGSRSGTGWREALNAAGLVHPARRRRPAVDHRRPRRAPIPVTTAPAPPVRTHP